MELEKTTVLLRRATIVEERYEEQPTQLTPIKQRQHDCKENHVTRQNQARLQKDLERIRFEQLGSVKGSPAKPSRGGGAARRAHPKQTLASVVFEVIVSNEERVKLRLREGDDLARLAGEVVLRHRLDDVRANRLLQAMQEAVRAKTSEEEGWEKHWDAKRQRWYAHHPASGRSKWAE